MTESEFVAIVSKIEFGDSRFINEYYSDIVRAAKDAGAKFGTENNKPIQSEAGKENAAI